MSFDDNQITVCNYKHFRPLLDNHLLLPIHNTYTKFEVHLNNLAHDTNTLYNILEVYLESYRCLNIYIDDIVDTVLVLTINQLLGDEAIRHSCGMRDIYLIRYQHPNNPTTQLEDIDEVDIFMSMLLKLLNWDLYYGITLFML